MVTLNVQETDAPIRQNRSHKNRVKMLHKPFVAWDGEGYTDETGEHHYNLFGCSESDYVFGDSLGIEECFELLLVVASKTDAIHVIFAGTYDLVMMIHKLPTKRCERIMQGKITWIGQYRVQYYRGKWLSLRDRSGRKIVLYDVYSFFASSFVRACQEYLGDDETLQAIANTKIQRSTFRKEDLETKVIPYWQEELRYLVKLCEELRARLLTAGIEMSQWHGPGAVATVVLKKNNIKPFMGEIPPEVTEIARHAYYGGRFEQFKLGHRNGPVYQYDINSAYPCSIAQLPSFSGAIWHHRTSGFDGSFRPFGLYQIRFHSRIKYFGNYPLPWRSDKGRIYYPALIGAPSWYWGIECANLLIHETRDYDILEAWEPELPPDRPFAFIEDMYLERLAMKQAGNPAQLAVKLALNSIYGKLAQSKGAKHLKDGWKIPSFHHLLWAGWITAATRAKLYDAIQQKPWAVIGVETDAIFTLEPLDLPVSTALGDWSMTEYNGITFIQSGVYFSGVEEGVPWKIKSRGFESFNQSHDAWLRVLSHSPWTEDAISFTVNRFGTVPGLSNWARWYQFKRETQFAPMTSKRVHIESICPSCKEDHSFEDALHPLAIPQSFIPSANISSCPHHLPWAEDTGHAWGGVWDKAQFDTTDYDTFEAVL